MGRRGGLGARYRRALARDPAADQGEKTVIRRSMLAAAALLPACALADVGGWRPDGAFVQVGTGEDTRSAAVGLDWDWRWSRPLGGGRLSGRHELLLGRWRADTGDGSHAGLTQLGYTPALRWWADTGAQGWFVEGGIGLHLLSPRYRSVEKRFGTVFNFGDHLGVGWRSAAGPRGLEWALRYQHFSNGGVKEPNPGLDFVQLRLSMPLHAAHP